MQSIPKPPNVVNSNLKALDVLKSIDNWVCYREESRNGDKPTKLPKNPHTGGNASSTNPQTWSGFIQAVKAQKKYDLTGLGWVFTKEAGIVGVDLDNCVSNGQVVDPWAMEVILALNSYTEISPSGKGLHVFIRGTIARALGPTPESPLEMYGWGRYFTVTGQHLPGTPLALATDAGQLETLWQAESSRRKGSEKEPGKPKDPNDLSPYTTKAYNDEIARFATSAEGCRNDTLNRVSFALGQFVQKGLLARAEVESTLLTIAVNLGLSDREAQRTIASGINGAYKNPRTTWPDDKQVANAVEPAPEKRTLQPGIDLVYHSLLPDTAHIAEKWGLNDEIINQFKLGYCQACPTSDYSDSVTIPYYRSGKLIDVRHRLGSPNGSGNYRPEVEGAPLNLFNIDTITDEPWVILVYGEFKAMLLTQYFLPVVAVPSESTSFNPMWSREFKADQVVYVVLDPDIHRQIAPKVCGAISHAGADARLVTLPVRPDEYFTQYGGNIDRFCQFLELGRQVVA